MVHTLALWLYPNSKFCLHHINPASLPQPLPSAYSRGGWSGSVAAFTEQMHSVHKYVVNKCRFDLEPETSRFACHLWHWRTFLIALQLVIFSASMLDTISYVLLETIQQEKTQWELFHG